MDLEEAENGKYYSRKQSSQKSVKDVKDAETFIQGLEDRSKMFNKTETTDEIIPMMVVPVPHSHKLPVTSKSQLEEIGKIIPDMDLYKNITSDVVDFEDDVAPSPLPKSPIVQSTLGSKLV